MRKEIKTAIVILVCAVLAAAGYWIYRSKISKPADVAAGNGNNYTPGNSIPKSDTGAKAGPSGNKPAAAILAGYQLYKSADFGFEIQYPVSWSMIDEEIENVRGEKTKAFYFKKPASDLRFAILPRDGLSYGLPAGDGDTSNVAISGFLGSQTKYTLEDGRRLWLIHPRYGLFNWSEDIGRIDILSSATDPAGDTRIFEQMLATFKLSQ